MGHSVTLDRLSFTTKLRPHEAQRFALFAQRSVAFGERFNSRTPGYRYRWQLGDGITIEYGDRASGLKNPHLRLDYNPAKHDLHRIEGLSRFLCNPWNITRVDVAVDYDADLASGLIRHDTLRKGAIFHGADGRTETVYLGSQQSDRFFRVYDKRREREAKKEPLPGTGPLWRVEVEWRCAGNDPLPPGLFDGVNITTIFDPGRLAWTTRTILRQLLLDPAMLNEAAKETRRRYRQLLDKHTAPLDPSPAEAYGTALPALRWQLDELRMLARGGETPDASTDTQETQGEAAEASSGDPLAAVAPCQPSEHREDVTSILSMF